jgi:hypothetical protein
VSCGASNQQRACALPPATAPQGTVSVTQSNEFGSDYQVLSVTYLLDDCVLQRIDDPGLLRKQIVIADPRKVTAGPHQFRSEITVRRAFESAFPVGWTIPVQVHTDKTNRFTVRVFEDENAPSGTIRIILVQERSEEPSAEGSPPPSP